MPLYTDDVVTLDDFSTDTIGAGKYTAQQGALGAWSIAGGVLTSTGGGVQVYRNDVSAVNCTVRGELVAGSTAANESVGFRKADGTGWILGNPLSSGGTFNLYSYDAAFGFTLITSPNSVDSAHIAYWELMKRGTDLRIRSYKADLTLIDDILGLAMSAPDQAAVVNPALRAVTNPAKWDEARFATLKLVLNSTARRRGTRAKAVRKTVGRSAKGGGSRSYKVGQVWPRGSRGK